MTDILILTTYAREIRPTMQDFLDRWNMKGVIVTNQGFLTFPMGVYTFQTLQYILNLLI